jgi:hypothetical protein
MATTTREATREVTTREAATTRNYSKKTEYYDEEEKGVVVEGAEIRKDGVEKDEEEMSSNQHYECDKLSEVQSEIFMCRV